MSFARLRFCRMILGRGSRARAVRARLRWWKCRLWRFFQAFGGDAHFVEQDFLQLFGRIEVERLVCGGIGLLFELHPARRRVPRFGGRSLAWSICTPLCSISNNTCADGQLHFFAYISGCFSVHLRARRCASRRRAKSASWAAYSVVSPDGDIGKTDLLRALGAQRFVGNGFCRASVRTIRPSRVSEMALDDVGSEHGVA